MEHDPTRRMLITALAGLTIASTVPVSSAAGTGSVQNKKPNPGRLLFPQR